MDGFFSLFNWLTNPSDMFAGAGFESMYEWAASCMSGVCAAYPELVWQNLGNSLSTAAGSIASAAGLTWESIFYLLPSGGHFAPEFHEAAIYMGNSLQSVGFMLPLDALVYCLLLSLNVFMGLYAFHITRVVVNFARGIGTDRFETVDDGFSMIRNKSSTRY